jgi:hypothetical protein
MILLQTDVVTDWAMAGTILTRGLQAIRRVPVVTNVD